MTFNSYQGPVFVSTTVLYRQLPGMTQTIPVGTRFIFAGRTSEGYNYDF